MTLPLQTKNQVRAVLCGIGTAVPKYSIRQEDAASAAVKFCPPEEKLLKVMPALYGLTRISKRGSVVLEKESFGETVEQSFFLPRTGPEDFGPGTAARMAVYERQAPLLAEQASRAALQDASTAAEAVTHLITVSCTGFSAPGFDIALIQSLGLSRGVSRTHIGFMGCHGMFNAFRVAQAYVRSDPSAIVLICSVELCTLHFSYDGNYERVLSNALFSDGASAAVFCGREEKGLWYLSESTSFVLPETEDHMSWQIGDHGFRMGISDKVPNVLGRTVKPWLENWLSKSGTTLNQIKAWAVHPGGPRILDEIRDALGIGDKELETARQILSNHGNMSSATILFILKEFLKKKSPAPCVAMSFGPGLTAEGALFLSL